MLVLSPAAVHRLMTYTPPHPLPKIFRMKKPNGTLDTALFHGSTINTPSMLCVEDYLDALRCVESIGGLEGCMSRAKANLAVLESFVAAHGDWISFLAIEPSTRSRTSVCLVLKLSKSSLATLRALLEDAEVAVDIQAYRDAPEGLRIWCGATVETADVKVLCTWLAWAYDEVIAREVEEVK